jgi:hypothetical protein
MSVLYPVGGKPPWPHSNRGVHLHAGRYQGGWMQPEDKFQEWIERLKRIKATWVVMITSGMSCVEVIDGDPAVEKLLQEGIVPIIRDDGKINREFENMDAVRKTARIYGNYGIKPIWIYRNEPWDDREWRGGIVPPNALEIYTDHFKKFAGIVLELGGIPAYADPLGDWDHIFSLMTDIADLWRDRAICFAGHFYGKARPIDYPEDDVSRLGLQLIDGMLEVLLDDFYDNPDFNDVPLHVINSERLRLADPDKTYLDDATCFGAWRNVRHWAMAHLGCEIAMCMTEGGWVPKDRAGSGPNSDLRFVNTTPKKVATKTLQMFEADDHGMFGVCPWLLSNIHMGGTGGWQDDSWCTGSWISDPGYPFDKTPVMTLLGATSPGEPEPPDTGVEPPDTGVEPPDTGVEPPDTGVEPPDTGVEPPDPCCDEETKAKLRRIAGHCRAIADLVEGLCDG